MAKNPAHLESQELQGFFEAASTEGLEARIIEATTSNGMDSVSLPSLSFATNASYEQSGDNLVVTLSEETTLCSPCIGQKNMSTITHITL